MPLEDFTSKTWKVKDTHTGSKPPQPDDTITFSGTKDEVTLTINGKPAWTGTYDPAKNSVNVNGSEIRLRITCKGGPPSGGSWTAEDTSGSDGDGD